MSTLLADGIARDDHEIWSTTATVAVTDPQTLSAARWLLDAVLLDVQTAASRFHGDSELTLINRNAGTEVTLSSTLNAMIDAALRVCRITDGVVDPTVAAAVIGLGYDRDIAALTAADLRPAAKRLTAIGTLTAATTPQRSPGITRIRHDAGSRRLLLPRGVSLDLGATAKAWASDRAAEQIAVALGCGVLVSIGGDVALAGPAPAVGWRVAVGEDHRTAERDGVLVAVRNGGLATSSTTVRRWRTPSGMRHHIVDPRTGANPEPFWRTASAVAASAVDANAASTAAIVLGPDAVGWLRVQQVPARLVSERGEVRYCAGWPADRRGAA